MKKAIAIGVLSLSSMFILSAKSYEITLNSPTKAGTVQLKPGQYNVKVEGSNVVFTDVTNASKKFTTPAKIQEGDKKFSDTKVQSSKQGDTDTIEEIQLGGSKTKVGF